MYGDICKALNTRESCL